MERDRALRNLREETFDVLVVGGGIVGCGIALDAAQRGLRVGLIERDDFASGTSSKSSKLIHGGLRYLRHLQFKVTLEASREKARLKRMAPHLIDDLPFLLPLWTRAARPMIASGLWIYDAAAGFPKGLIHRHLDRKETLEQLPGLRAEGLKGGYVYYDARADDCRLVLHVARKAVELGATLVNHLPAVALIKERGRVRGVRTPEFPIAARRVVNATGVWCDDLRAMDDREAAKSVRPSKGVHLVLPAERLPIQTAAMLPSPADRRIVFLIPWAGRMLIGTTDTDYGGSIDHPRAETEDVDYLLAVVNAALPEARLRRSDVLSSFAGLRPLLLDGSETPSSAPREHRILDSASGLLSITGGKLTTWRLMAKQVVDRLTKTRCRTHALSLFATDARDPLARLYGSEAARIQDRRPLIEGLPHVWGEIDHAVEYEMARTLRDVLTRRLRISLTAKDQGRSIARAVAERLASRLGWDGAEIERQCRDYALDLESGV